MFTRISAVAIALALGLATSGSAQAKPKTDAPKPAAPTRVMEKPKVAPLLDINTATREQLVALPAIDRK